LDEAKSILFLIFASSGDQETKVILLRLPPSSFSNSKSYTAQRHSVSGRSAMNASYDVSSEVFSTIISEWSLFRLKTMYLNFFLSLSSWKLARHSGFAATPDDILDKVNGLESFQALKLGKKFKYIVFNLNKDHSEIIVEKTSQDPSYDAFIADLPENECRWAVYDFEFEKEDAGKRSKITFVSWSPDDAKIKNKMLFASSKDALRRALVGVAVEIQGTDYSEVSYESVLEKASRGN